MHATVISYFFLFLVFIIVHGQEWRDELNLIRREQRILKNIIKELRMANRQLHSRIIKVKEDNRVLHTTVKEIALIAHQHDDGYTSFQNDTINAYWHSQNHSSTTQEKKDDRMTRMVPIAFSAFIAEKFDYKIGSQHTFVYDAIRSNNGNAYNPLDGIFTAPHDGIFAFLWTISAEGTKGTDGYFGEVNTELVVNFAVRGRSHADTELIYDDDKSTGFAILNLNEGDHVFIRSGFLQGQLQFHHQMEWTFSGWEIA